MNNIVILPIIIPMITGLFLILFRRNIKLQFLLSLISLSLTGISAAYLAYQVKESGIQTVQVGGWSAPFGISMVADMFSMILVITTSVVAIAGILYASKSIEESRKRYFFYPFYLFLIVGVNGSFITGDIFNLFVCFEVMLIASYILISHGGTKIQLRETVKYVLVNIVSSALFLVGIAYLYAITGTLNMAHISMRIAEVGQDGLLTTVSIVFLVVFSMKAALFLFFWLPGSYSAPPTAVAAIFAALLTKVGIYAIFRMFTLVFYHEPHITHLIIGILGAITMIFGAIGAIAYWDLKKIIGYNVIIGVGFIIVGLASFTAVGLTGSIYYLVHDIIIKALLFLIIGTVITLTGTSNLKDISGLIRLHPSLGWMYFITALSLAGIPPLSGFLGKIFITEGSFEANLTWLGAIGLISSLMVLYSVIKIFLYGFLGETTISEEMEKGSTKGIMLPIAVLTFLTISLGLGGELLAPYVNIAVDSLLNPIQYIDAVIGGRN
ncbi:Na+/H+ antiporter subunit D [Sutcliffiella cohnii]|uniref:Na+/H+ antiporter subunit D n=1 Tax=Sutcliffiella cohnii TaxID=33932 RepID=A0A223KT83_9BACI|nr:Na+/H+ antiporter subunit D [Sutcliffiella cohnii]AST92577.1 Na+/H+ antiporter subunit D [Sutcliffiella cohnii]